MHYNVLALGAGVQSSVLFLMSCFERTTLNLPKLDCAIFADTQFEPKIIYEYLEKLKTFSKIFDIPIHVVTAGNIKEECLNQEVGKRFVAIPFFVKDSKDKIAKLKRQCTKHYKIEVIRTFLRRNLLGLKYYQNARKSDRINLWFGISSDEIKRIKISTDKWQKFVYPLIERNFSRSRCLDWVDKLNTKLNLPPGFLTPSKSSCICCPFHNESQWARMQRYSPEEFKEAVDFDNKIRNLPTIREHAYLHRSCQPLEQIDFSKYLDESCSTISCDENYCGL